MGELHSLPIPDRFHAVWLRGPERYEVPVDIIAHRRLALDSGDYDQILIRTPDGELRWEPIHWIRLLETDS